MFPDTLVFFNLEGPFKAHMEHEEAGSGEVAHGSGSECAAADNIATQPQGGKWAKVQAFYSLAQACMSSRPHAPVHCTFSPETLKPNP